MIEVLFIEDEPDVQFIVQISLTHSGLFEITSFSSGIDALKAISTSDAKFDLALVNVQLPTMNGIEFVEHMRDIPGFADVPVIFITASVSSRELAHLKGEGVLGVISKPFDAVTLASEVERLFASR
ncbi:response regulator [Sphingomonas sp. SRS2]|uniref:response regulator n=1 Tax=Sphingomonas sp. SRS2 TaxID=133190 RepID=UPI0006184320|nr:response regulator [Sphingomonas sp. SRS2]KKC27087.1 hypothetical protein WP12_05240 [Sphingomonas sp. SRS2]